jgi:hypothetical protein
MRGRCTPLQFSPLFEKKGYMSIKSTDIEWHHWITMVAAMGLFYAHLVTGPKTTIEAWVAFGGFATGFSVVLGALTVAIFGMLFLIRVRGKTGRILTMLVVILVYCGLIMQGVNERNFVQSSGQASSNR